MSVKQIWQTLDTRHHSCAGWVYAWRTYLRIVLYDTVQWWCLEGGWQKKSGFQINSNAIIGPRNSIKKRCTYIQQILTSCMGGNMHAYYVQYSTCKYVSWCLSWNRLRENCFEKNFWSWSRNVHSKFSNLQRHRELNDGSFLKSLDRLHLQHSQCMYCTHDISSAHAHIVLKKLMFSKKNIMFLQTRQASTSRSFYFFFSQEESNFSSLEWDKMIMSINMFLIRALHLCTIPVLYIWNSS